TTRPSAPPTSAASSEATSSIDRPRRALVWTWGGEASYNRAANVRSADANTTGGHRRPRTLGDDHDPPAANVVVLPRRPVAGPAGGGGRVCRPTPPRRGGKRPPSPRTPPPPRPPRRR